MWRCAVAKTLLSAIRRLFHDSGSPESTFDSQRGYAVLTLALLGLLATGVMSGPILGRVGLNTLSNSVESQEFLTTSGAASGAEHALWRIVNDPLFLDTLTGSPPSITYELSLPGGTTTITVAASSNPPVDDGITAVFTVAPSIVSPLATSTLTYSMTVTNADSVPHEINRVETKSWFWSPVYITDSTSGFTSVSPTQGGFWRWDISPPAVIPAFGGEVTMQYQVIGSEDWGTFWTTGSARIVDVGTIGAPTTARVRFMDLNTLGIETSVAPDEVSAGPTNTFDFAVDITNSSSSPLTMRWIRHYADDQFAYVPGSSSGLSVADPDTWWNPITSRYTYEWALGGAALAASSTAQLAFQMDASLLPGIHTTRTSIKVEEDEGSVHKFFDLSSFETGETAPITAKRAFTISAVQGAAWAEIEAFMLASGADIISWSEGVN